jgi:choline kinase
VPTSLRLEVVHNAEFDLPNGVSLLAAERWAADRFFVQMADHVFLAPVLRYLEATGFPPDDAPRLLVDEAPQGLDEDDATKVRIRDGLITAIGKDVVPWDAIDTGCFRMDHRIFEALREAATSAPPSLSAGMARLASAGLLVPVPLPAVAWVDVDTPRDRVRAEGLHALVIDVAS